MKVVALEEHMFPREVLVSAGLDLGSRASRRAAELDEVGEGRLAVMDEAGIDVQVLSTLGNIVQEFEPERASSVSRELNDRMAVVVTKHPDRFRGFATMPMTAPEVAADELRRGVEELGFVGAMIHGQTQGVFLDDPSVQPILATAERLGVPIYLHPGLPPAAVHDAYYAGFGPEISAGLAGAGWGWHSECALHVLRMVVAGVFERFPELQLIVGHMGEGLPFHLDRIETMLTPLVGHHDRTVGETLRNNLHLTTSGYNTATPLLCALLAFGADRILFSVDHPFADSVAAATFLRHAPISGADREKLAYRNAESLLFG
ncbi:amidohydrolase family protein [Cryptosporangium sp. NPDC048952]|uniref:amidohydrolase family protein n=1 Tax=Cryptosporangium sp. NPDC048952 TaxID=3363961 RepID=UPI0037143EFF